MTDHNSRIDEWLRIRNPAKLAVRGIAKSRLVVTEVRFDQTNYGMSDRAIPQDAFAFGLQLRNYPLHEVWSGGKATPVHNVRAGDTLVCNLANVESVSTNVPFHSLQFFISRSFLDELANDLEAPRIGGFRTPPGYAVADQGVAFLGKTIWPLLSNPDEVDELSASQFMLAFGTYVAAKYGQLKTGRRRPGGLSNWQERLSKELLDAHIAGQIAISELATCCGISTSHFAHAFKTSTGVAPHQWLLRRRAERAQDLLRRTSLSLAQIAQLCGFADQSHFNRVFQRLNGVSPGAWKRSL